MKTCTICGIEKDDLALGNFNEDIQRLSNAVSYLKRTQKLKQPQVTERVK